MNRLPLEGIASAGRAEAHSPRPRPGRMVTTAAIAPSAAETNGAAARPPCAVGLSDARRIPPAIDQLARRWAWRFVWSKA
ncbi:MAG: hypothetical protein JWQ05_3007 [Methylobacterium sp.]|nr:hypothetical protein [Methylobacterium sp.]